MHPRVWRRSSILYDCCNIFRNQTVTVKPFSTTAVQNEQVQADILQPVAEPVPPLPNPESLDPNTVIGHRNERRLIRSGTFPVGSRRRRAALSSSPNIPFEQLPYQCFQEARKVLLEDRQEKIQQIEAQRARIERLRDQVIPINVDEEQQRRAALVKDRRLASMRERLGKLKILADINDPLIKKRFEDGTGDMNRPIYRFLADRKWRSQKRLIQMQRLTQMNVIPDLLPTLDLIADVGLSFGRFPIKPGAFVPSPVSERPPKLTVQCFDSGSHLYTIVVVDPDVPNVDTDRFDARCHYLAVNIPLSPTNVQVSFGKMPGQSMVSGIDAASSEHLVEAWTPPFAQKGSPYHRICICAMRQPEGLVIDVSQAKSQLAEQRDIIAQAKAKGSEGREQNRAFIKDLMRRHQLRPVGAFLFRTQWDDSMDSLMTQLDIEGVGTELKRKRILPLPHKKKPGDGEKRYR